jgi:hypothetical protein
LRGRHAVCGDVPYWRVQEQQPGTSDDRDVSAAAELSAAGPILNEVNTEVPGISQRQNILATGSLLGLAKTRMPADQFAEVARAIPGAEALIVEAARQGVPRSALTNLTSVTEYLGKQGVTQDQVTQRIIPVLDKAVKGKSHPGSGSQLQCGHPIT